MSADIVKCPLGGQNHPRLRTTLVKCTLISPSLLGFKDENSLHSFLSLVQLRNKSRIQKCGNHIITSLLLKLAPDIWEGVLLLVEIWVVCD